MSLINSIIGSIGFKPISDVIFKDREFNQEKYKAKGGFVDILCLGSDNKIYNVEFQNDREKYFVNRIFYYMSRLMINIKEGADYSEVKNVCNIAILNHNFFTDLDNKFYFHPFRYQHQIVKDYYLSKSPLFFIEIPKWENVKPEIEDFTDLDVFLAFFSKESTYEYLMEIAKRSEIMAQLMELQDDYRKDSDLLLGYKTAEDYERDYRSAINSNREEAKDEAKREIVLNMKKKNYDIETIADVTGLSPEVINSYLQ